MIVWSRGLGKQRLHLALSAASLDVKPDVLMLEGEIDRVCWNYAVRLTPGDLDAFLKLLAKPATTKFLAERGGLLLPFIAGLIVRAPGLIFGMLLKKTPPKGGEDALLV